MINVTYRPLTAIEHMTYNIKCEALQLNKMQCTRRVMVAKETVTETDAGSSFVLTYYCSEHALYAKQHTENAALTEADNYGLRPEHVAAEPSEPTETEEDAPSIDLEGNTEVVKS